MKTNRTKNATRNIVWGLANKFITLIMMFVLRTIMLRVMGAEYLGLNSIFTSVLQVLNLAELGFSSAVVFSMYKPIAEDDKTAICALMSFYRTVYRIVGIVVLVVGLALMPFLRYLIKGSIPSDVNIYILYLIYLANTSISYFLFAYKTSLLDAHQRSDIVSNVNSIVYILQYCIQIAIVVIFKNYYAFIILQPIFTAANNIITAAIARKKYPEYICRGKLDKGTLNDIKKKVGGLMIQKVCATTRNSIDSIVVSSFMGLTAVTIYNNYYYIISAIHTILGIVTSSLRAGIGNSIASESVEKNHTDMHKFIFLYAWISGWCTVCLVCLYQPFMLIWTKDSSLLLPFYVMMAFAVYFYSMCMGDIRTLYNTGAGLWWEGRYRSLMESVTNIVLNIVLGYFFGIFGIVLATIISILIINFGYGSHIVFKFYFKNGKLGRFYGMHALYALVTLAAGAATYFACSFISLTGIKGLIVKAVICIILPNIIYFIIYCRTKIFKDSIKIVGNVMRIFKSRFS